METDFAEKLRLRYANKRDFPYVRDLTYKLIDESGVGEKENVESVLEQMLSSSDTHVKVCEYDGSIISTATLQVVKRPYGSTPELGWICAVITDKQYRGKGAASILIRDLLQIAKGAGCPSVALECARDRVSFYERFGFRIDELRPEGYRMVLYQNDRPATQSTFFL